MGALQPIELTQKWIEAICQAAPEKPTVAAKQKRRALLFFLCTSSEHWVILHTSAMVRVLAEKSGAFEVVESLDPEVFVPDSPAGFDAITLSNTCPMKREKRNLFFDALQDEAGAAEQRDNVIEFVAEGGGFVSVHAGIIACNDCPEWEDMQGAVSTTSLPSTRSA